MNIKNFDSYFSDKILERGMNYYNNNSVKEIKQLSAGFYKANVMGSYKYCVKSNILKNGDIISIQCNCPYEFGDYCKHEAAFLYKFRDNFNKNIDIPIKNDIKDLLKNLSKNDLINTIEEIVKQNESLEYIIKIKFSEIYTDDFFISEYKSAIENCNNINDLYYIAETIIDKTQNMTKFERNYIYKKIIDEIDELSEEVYDENGILYDIIELFKENLRQ